MKKLVLAVSTLVATSGLIACSSGTASTPTRSADGLTVLNVGNIKIAAQTDAYAADKLGYFKKHGLKVNTTFATNGGDLLTAVESGSLDMGLSIPGNAITAVAKGFDYVGVVQDQIAHEKGPDSGGLVVAANSGIKSLKDLEGRRVAVNATGGNQVYVSVVKTLQDAGVDISKVSFQEIPFPQMPAVLGQGQVDAVATVDPFTTKLLSGGNGREIAWFYSDALPGMPIGTYFAKGSWLKQNAETATAFRDAMDETIMFLNANPDKAKDLVAEFTGLDRGLLNTAPNIQWSTTVSRSNWEKLVQIYIQQGILKDPIAVDKLLSPGALTGATN